MSHSTTLKLVYWDMRGFAEPIRHLLRYTKVPFEDIRHSFTHNGEFPSRESWLNEKHTLKLTFPNLPYLIDGSFRTTQSVAILKYLARKHGLVSENANDQAKEDLIEAQILDIRNRLIIAFCHKSFSTDADFETELDIIREEFAVWLSQFESWIGSKQWLIGDKLSYVDFLAFEYFDWYRVLLQPTCFEQFPKISSFMSRFAELPNLKDYLASDEFKKAPILSPYAKLGYRFK